MHTPKPTSLSTADVLNQTEESNAPAINQDTSVAELSKTVEDREKWKNSIWCLSIHPVLMRNIPVSLEVKIDNTSNRTRIQARNATR